MKDRRNQLEKPDCHTVRHGACRGYCQLYDAYSEALDHIKRLEERIAAHVPLDLAGFDISDLTDITGLGKAMQNYTDKPG